MKKIIMALFIVTAMISCSNETTLEKIKRLEPQMLEASGRLNKEVCAELVETYQLYAEQNPDEAKSPDYLFIALDISVNLNADDSQKTIAIADILIDKYPDYLLTPMAMFLKGFVYENKLGDLQNAEMTYRQFIEKYPDNPMVEDVKSTLENLGLSPEELIRKFESKNEAAE
mgnify:CR=1 FL=1